MITDNHRKVLKEIFRTGPVRKVHDYFKVNNIVHPRTGRVPSYNTVRYVYNGVRPNGDLAEDEFIEKKIFEFAEIYKLEKIKQKHKNNAKAEKLKNLK